MPLSVSVDGPDSGIPYNLVDSFRNLALLHAFTDYTVNSITIDYVSALIAKGLLRPDPADATKFQVKLSLRIAYPFAAGTPDVISGSGPLPLVLLNHGHYDSWKPLGLTFPSTGPTTVQPPDIAISPSYQGYAYLQSALAACNIVSVSVDHNLACFTKSFIETRADTVIAALNALGLEAKSSTSRYCGRLDFSRIGLMGHSRGGDAVVRAVKKILADPTLSATYTIKTVCSLAPTDFTGSSVAANRMFLDVNDVNFYLVMYGALDGDVSGYGGATGIAGTGFRHYDRARCNKAMVFLDTCCHDYFNTVWLKNPHEDGIALSTPATSSTPAITYDPLDPRIASPADHQSIAIDYLGDLFQWQLNGVALPERFNGIKGNRVGVHASLQWMFGTTLTQIDDFENTGTTNLLGDTRTVLNTGVPTGISDFASITVSGTSLSAHTGHQTNVLYVDLTTGSPGSTRILEESIPAANQDWSSYDTLIISLSGWFDPTSATTIANANLPRLTISLEDTNNMLGMVNWEDYGTALPSRPMFKNLPLYGGNLTLMRLETIPIALDLFVGADLTKIMTVSLDILPNNNNNTYVFIDNIHVLKR